ncbi:MAG: hypothetical protein QOI83_2888 [Streptomycetaceae bacterium]|nr:hypothetical protein [Streptomycetaceae bacterium]
MAQVHSHPAPRKHQRICTYSAESSVGQNGRPRHHGNSTAIPCPPNREVTPAPTTARPANSDLAGACPAEDDVPAPGVGVRAYQAHSRRQAGAAQARPACAVGLPGPKPLTSEVTEVSPLDVRHLVNINEGRPHLSVFNVTHLGLRKPAGCSISNVTPSRTPREERTPSPRSAGIRRTAQHRPRTIHG